MSSKKQSKSPAAKEVAAIIDHARKQPGFKQFMKAFMAYHIGAKSK